MMYQKPKDPDKQIEDWATVLNSTKSADSMVGYYAFHGAYSDVCMAKSYLVNNPNPHQNKERWIAALDDLLKISRDID